LQKDEDFRQGVWRSPKGRGLAAEHVHSQAGIEIELVEKEIVGMDCGDVVGLEGRLGQVAEVEGDDDFGVGAYGGSQNVPVPWDGSSCRR
jgi:hypothetical protein